jgi:hypothetical protein
MSQLALAFDAERVSLASVTGLWRVSHKFDRDGARLADGHYSRRTPGSPQFMPPGETLVLVAPARDAVFGWWRPHPNAHIVPMNGLYGWTCTIFRRTGGAMASDLVLAAEIELLEADARGDLAGPCGPDGLLTYVWPSRIPSTNPGWCFQVAGWTRGEWTAKGKRLLRKPWRLAGIAACGWSP